MHFVLHVILESLLNMRSFLSSLCLYFAVGFLRSGTKLPFSRHRQNAGLSQSHDDLSDAAANSHKKIGSLPRRLLKHFSLKKAKSKPSVNGSAQGGDK